MEAAQKKVKISSERIICTHNGTFHCDDVLAVYLLRMLPEYKDAQLIRTRDAQKIDQADIVVDVGAVYDHENRRYDHHQRTFSDVFGNGFNTKLSSVGLIYKHYGKRLVAAHMNADETSQDVEKVWLKVYQEFIESIDAIDNGINAHEAGTSLKYKIKTDLSSRVGFLNPRWNENSNDEILMSKFVQASQMAGQEFTDCLSYYSSAWLPGFQIVQTAFDQRKNHHDSGKIIVFNQYAPWKDHLYQVEQNSSIPEAERPLYVLYPDESNGSYRIQAVNVSSDSFENRLSLPEKWRGVRDEALSSLTGIDGCIFVHASGFIGGNKTLEGAFKMAEQAINDVL